MIFKTGKKAKKKRVKESSVDEEKKQKKSESERIEEGEILISAVIEILGKPKKFIQDTLKIVIGEINSGDDFEIIDKRIARAKKIEGLYSTFAELEMWVKSASSLIGFCFDYMPSSLEVILPTELNMRSSEFSGLMNDLLAKLHQTDMVAKNMKQENENLKANANNLLKNIVSLALSTGPKGIEEISRSTGLASQHLKPFLDVFEKEGKLKLNNGKYELLKVL